MTNWKERIEEILKSYGVYDALYLDSWSELLEELETLINREKEESYRMGLQQKNSFLHEHQMALLEFMHTKDINNLTLREIGEATGIDHPQKVKHHLERLISNGFVDIVAGRKVISKNYLKTNTDKEGE